MYFSKQEEEGSLILLGVATNGQGKESEGVFREVGEEMGNEEVGRREGEEKLRVREAAAEEEAFTAIASLQSYESETRVHGIE